MSEPDAIDLDEWQRQKAADPRSHEELLETARKGWDGDDQAEDQALDALWVIAARAGPGELEGALAGSRSDDRVEREMSAFVLGRMGNSGRPAFLDETVSRLLELTADPNPSVIAVAAYALGHRGSPRATPRLIELAGHENESVREAVAFALGGIPDPGVTRALVRLMSDVAVEVRDWGTFALGTLHETIDSAEVRAALFSRVDDVDEDVRGEALVGLARRNDGRAVELVRRELCRNENPLVVEAAGMVSDRSLLPELERRAERWPSAELRELIDRLRKF